MENKEKDDNTISTGIKIFNQENSNNSYLNKNHTNYSNTSNETDNIRENINSNIDDINTSQLPMAKSETQIDKLSSDKQQQTQKEGMIKKMWNYMKSINWNQWKIEEEEYIDAHGFKSKRPKKKIPLRKVQDQYQDDIAKVGSDSFSYASQRSGFGKLFL